MEKEQLYDRVSHSLASIFAQLWVLSLPTTSVLLFTLHVMNFSLRTGFGDSDLSTLAQETTFSGVTPRKRRGDINLDMCNNLCYKTPQT